MSNRIRAVAGMLALALSMQARAQSCRSDLNGDGVVNGADLGILPAVNGTSVASQPPCSGKALT